LLAFRTDFARIEAGWLTGVALKLRIAGLAAAAVLDTRVVLRSVKSWGRMLGMDGRACDVVPVDLWSPAR
jgi:hypothetical protein